MSNVGFWFGMTVLGSLMALALYRTGRLFYDCSQGEKVCCWECEHGLHRSCPVRIPYPPGTRFAYENSRYWRTCPCWKILHQWPVRRDPNEARS